MTPRTRRRSGRHEKKPTPHPCAPDQEDLLSSADARRSWRHAATAAAGFAREIDEETRCKLSPAAIRACNKIGEAWHLKPNEVALLLAMTLDDYEHALASSNFVVLEPAQFDRAGLLISIFGVLGRLFDQRLADEWPQRPNSGKLFGGRSAVEVMKTGEAESMKEVLRHLYAVALGL